MGKKRGKSPILSASHSTSRSLFSDSFHTFDRFSIFSQSKTRKAQISTFLIISLVLVLFVAVIFFVINSQLSLREKASQSVVSELSLFPPEKFISHCVQKEVVDLSRTILEQGGVYDLTKNSTYNGRSLDSISFRVQPYLFWSRYSPSLGNQFISSEFVAEQLNEQLPRALTNCINLSLYGDQGYEVRAGKLLSNTTISADTVNVVVYYPLNLKKGETTIDRSLYSTEVDLPIGSLLSMAREIVNSHINSQPLDTQSLMHQDRNNWLSKPLIVVDKNTVYPNTLYSLQLNYKEISIPLRFAVEGADIFSATKLTNAGFEKSSCITPSGACFDSVSYNVCTKNGGEFIQDEICSQHNWPISDSASDAFKKCVFSDGSSIPSGSSWCAAGDDGQPFIGVGSRHSRLLCVNGEVLQEPCQDYRLEVCAQTQSDGLLVAQCQPNVAASCSQCSDKNCCESVGSGASCTYTSQQACVPKVSLGIPFWKPDLSVCQDQFNMGLVAAGGKISSPTAQATLCAQYADCGATISVIGETTQSQSTLGSDYYARLSSFWQQQSIPYVDLSDFNQVQAGGFSDASLSPIQQTQSVSSLLSKALADVEQLASYDAKEYLDPNVSVTLTTQTLSCRSYLAPKSPSCSFCELYDKACSDYVCRSLGSSCRAISNVSASSGVTCIDSSLVDIKPLHITAITDSHGVALADTSLAGISGYKVVQPLSAHELLTINLTTDRLARCKPTYLPALSFADVGSLDLSSGVYTTQHQLKIKFVNDLPVFDRVLANFAVPDYSQLVEALAQFKLRLDQLRIKYGFMQKYNPTFYPYLNAVVEQYLSDKTRPALLELMNGIAQKRFAIFFVCQDEYGNEIEKNSVGQIQNPFVEFTLQSSCLPQPPEILSIVPDADPYVQKSVTLYLNKLGSCKYDVESYAYDSMSYNMSCASSEYDLSSNFDGSYACTADTTVLPQGTSQIYVSCSDKVASALTAKSILLNFDETASPRVVVNISNESLSLASSSIAISSRANIWTGFGYRCSLATSPLDSSNNFEFALSCSGDACSITHKNLTQAQIEARLQINAQDSLVCVPRVPSSSCSVSQTHNSAPQVVALQKLPSFVFDEAAVYGREFVVSVKSRGTPITCSLTSESGQTYSLSARDDNSFVMSASVLADKSLVTVTCGDGYGVAKFVSLVKK